MIIKKNIFSTKKISWLPVLICFFYSQNVYSQTSTSSPYSRFGIGDLTSITFARNLSLGGTEIGVSHPSFINYGNPAAYSDLLFTTYEGGANFSQYELKTNTAVHRTHTASVSYFDFAFPIKPQHWSVGFGLLPYSKVGYSITERSTTTYGDIEQRSYDGNGGLNNFHIGTGFKLAKKFSAGVTAEYLFGVIDHNRTIAFSTTNYFNTSVTNSTSIGWFHFKTGIQYLIDSLPFAKSDSLVMYEKEIKTLSDSLHSLVINSSSDTTSDKYATRNLITQQIAIAEATKKNLVYRHKKSDWNLNLGLSLSPAANLHATNSVIGNSFRFNSTLENVIVRDTSYNSSNSGNVKLPLNAGLGFSLTKGNKWMFCGDYSMQQWNDFTFLGAADSLVNSWKTSFGIQLVPNDRALKSYLKVMQYRIGFHYEQTFLKLNGKNINDIGVSAGVALPIRKAATMLHFTFEAGKRGTMENNLILEKYFKFTLGFTINDKWFVKPKYD